MSKKEFNPFFTPAFAANAIFSIELYFKTICDFYGQKIRGHHLVELFKKMPNMGKTHIYESSNACLHLYNLKEPTDIESCLAHLNKGFEEWRYMYEHNRLHLDLQKARYTMHVAHEACNRCREEER